MVQKSLRVWQPPLKLISTLENQPGNQCINFRVSWEGFPVAENINSGHMDTAWLGFRTEMSLYGANRTVHTNLYGEAQKICSLQRYMQKLKN